MACSFTKQTRLSGCLTVDEASRLPISVVRWSLSVLSNPMTPANDSSGGCHSGNGNFPGMTGFEAVFPEVSNIAKMTLPCDRDLAGISDTTLEEQETTNRYGSNDLFVTFEHLLISMSRIGIIGHPFHELFVSLKLMGVMGCVPGWNEGDQGNLGRR